ncbi:hypothetical protein QBC45DRAFT_389210 [Copromyces sp. CBS 386.78]|nr:hypothetical protein QBC45DRAFT_389210 [Copromyces sp. CBS 386.78]
MAETTASASPNRCPPKKRARTDSDLEESSPNEDEDPRPSEDEEEEDLADEKDYYLSILTERKRRTGEPLIPTSVRDDLLAFAAARDPHTIGKSLQEIYEDDLFKDQRTIDIELDYNLISFNEQVKILSALPPDQDASESSTRLRQLFTTADKRFDLLLRRTDFDSEVEDKGDAARDMQRILRRLLTLSNEFDQTIPEDFSSGRGRPGLDGKMLSLIKDKFNHKNHDIKMMMVCEDPMGGSNWVGSVQELVKLSSRVGDGVFKKLRQVLKLVEADRYNPATDYDSCGAPTF